MATEDEIAALRLLIAESTEAKYTDSQLSDRLDADGSENLTAYQVWTEKAASIAMLADISEGGSSRSQGQLMDKALKMATLFKQRYDEETATPDPVRVGTTISRLRRR